MDIIRSCLLMCLVSSKLTMNEWENTRMLSHSACATQWIFHEFSWGKYIWGWLNPAFLPGNSTELPQDLLSYLRIYWATSEFTELPEKLLSYLRIYWATSEFTVLPQNLLCYLGILLNYLGFWKFKFECYLAPRKCTNDLLSKESRILSLGVRGALVQRTNLSNAVLEPTFTFP